MEPDSSSRNRALGDSNSFTDENIAQILRSKIPELMSEFCIFLMKTRCDIFKRYLIGIGAQEADAEDAIAEVLLRLATWNFPDKALYDPNRLGKFGKRTSFNTWFIVAIKYQWWAIKGKHGQGISLPQDVQAPEEASDDPGEERRLDQAKASVEAFTKGLPEPDQQIVKWYLKRLESHQEKPNWPELAKSLEGTESEMTVGAIRARYHRLCKDNKGRTPPLSAIAPPGNRKPPSSLMPTP